MQQNLSNPQAANLPYSLYPMASHAPMAYNMPQMQARTNAPSKYHKKCVLGLSISLISLGSLCFMVQFCEIFLTRISGLSGAGIWSGTFFIITGVVGCISSKKTTNCTIVSFMVLSIIGAILSIAPLVAGAIGWGLGEAAVKYGFDLYHREMAGTAMNAIMVFIALTNFVLMVISSGYACHGLCPGSSQSGTVVSGQIQYVLGPNGQQHIMVVPMAQPVYGAPHYQAWNNPTGTPMMLHQQVGPQTQQVHQVPPMMLHQQVVGTNPTTGTHTVQVQPGTQAGVSAQAEARPPPAYHNQVGLLPEYEEKLPMAE